MVTSGHDFDLHYYYNRYVGLLQGVYGATEKKLQSIQPQPSPHTKCNPVDAKKQVNSKYINTT